MKIWVLLAAVALATLCDATSFPRVSSVLTRPNSQEGSFEQAPEDNITEVDIDDSEERAFLEEVREEFAEMESMESTETEFSLESIQDTSAPRPPVKRVRTQKTKCSLEGAWRNDHGSEMVLNMTAEGHIIGEYRTAVESKLGAAGDGPSLIRGAGGRSGASTFGFSVVWRGGASTTTWAGQCLICDGQEILETTWLLVGEVAGCEDSWMSTRVGKDTFYRIPKQEVRKYKGHLVPRD
uniref:Avidin 2 n=1 Tax=Branchiostoma japonicum TaxID=373177 RepID=A0A1W5XGF1_9BRAN|nr:avidin 2 [Branchiostoma japonicum]